MAGDIPLLVSKFKDIILKQEYTYLLLSIDNQIQGNTTFSIFITVAKLTTSGFTPPATYCSGLLCDKVRINNCTGNDRGCRS